jgi:hypothetical protein
MESQGLLPWSLESITDFYHKLTEFRALSHFTFSGPYNAVLLKQAEVQRDMGDI